MTPEERIKYAKEKTKEFAKKLLEEMPEEIRKEFVNERTQGNADNLVKPDPSGAYRRFQLLPAIGALTIALALPSRRAVLGDKPVAGFAPSNHTPNKKPPVLTHWGFFIWWQLSI